MEGGEHISWFCHQLAFTFSASLMLIACDGFQFIQFFLQKDLNEPEQEQQHCFFSGEFERS